MSKVADRAHLEAMTNPRRHCVQKENSRKRDGNFLQQDKGAFWFMKDNLILSASDTKCFLAMRRGVLNDPLKLLDEI